MIKPISFGGLKSTTVTTVFPDSSTLEEDKANLREYAKIKRADIAAVSRYDSEGTISIRTIDGKKIDIAPDWAHEEQPQRYKKGQIFVDEWSSGIAPHPQLDALMQDAHVKPQNISTPSEAVVLLKRAHAHIKNLVENIDLKIITEELANRAKNTKGIR